MDRIPSYSIKSKFNLHPKRNQLYQTDNLNLKADLYSINNDIVLDSPTTSAVENKPSKNTVIVDEKMVIVVSTMYRYEMIMLVPHTFS